jgi:hypothetical protein
MTPRLGGRPARQAVSAVRDASNCVGFDRNSVTPDRSVAALLQLGVQVLADVEGTLSQLVPFQQRRGRRRRGCSANASYSRRFACKPSRIGPPASTSASRHNRGIAEQPTWPVTAPDRGVRRDAHVWRLTRSAPICAAGLAFAPARASGTATRLGRGSRRHERHDGIRRAASAAVVTVGGVGLVA